MDTATPAEVQKIRLEDTSWILLDRTAKSCMSLANSYVTFWRKMLNFHSMWHHRRRIFHRIFRNRWTSASHQGRCQGEGEVLLLDAEDVNEKEKEKVMRHGSNLLWLKRLRQVWSTSLYKTFELKKSTITIKTVLKRLKDESKVYSAPSLQRTPSPSNSRFARRHWPETARLQRIADEWTCWQQP